LERFVSSLSRAFWVRFERGAACTLSSAYVSFRLSSVNEGSVQQSYGIIASHPTSSAIPCPPLPMPPSPPPSSHSPRCLLRPVYLQLVYAIVYPSLLCPRVPCRRLCTRLLRVLIYTVSSSTSRHCLRHLPASDTPPASSNPPLSSTPRPSSSLLHALVSNAFATTPSLQRRCIHPLLSPGPHSSIAHTPLSLELTSPTTKCRPVYLRRNIRSASSNG
jgi:hypothetical protein